MLIRKLRTNHIERPIGYTLDPLTLSWITESNGSEQAYARVTIALDSDFDNIVFDSGEGKIDNISYCPDLKLKPRTRYYWQVEVMADNGDCGSAQSFFETGKMKEDWQAKWIKAPFDESPLMVKDFDMADVVSVKAYVVGLGIFELYCNGVKVGDEYLAPGFHSYDYWIQSHTYDLTDYIHKGRNTLGFMLGDGWYKGLLGWKGIDANTYGDNNVAKAEFHFTMSDGSEHVIITDQSWLCHKNPVTKSSIYYGEDYDANLEVEDWSLPICERKNFLNAEELNKGPHENICDRLSPPIKKFETFKPTVLHTKKNETVLDFGQNHAGWVEGDIQLEKGKSIKLSYGELLQDDCFYNENLRTAEAQFTYVSNGKAAHFRPHFTYYGYRYVKVEGDIDEKSLESFTSYALYSELDSIGTIETSNPKVNQLISNALWGQKSNFVDVPTDCPQRDERLGWTGDTQAFSGTASFNMYTPAFYNKYMKDLLLEQKELNGGVPFTVPLIKTDNSKAILAKHSACAWGDVATILPWTVYLFYGDKGMLKSHYQGMKDWVDYIKGQDEKAGLPNLWQTGFQFGDWLALDNYKNPNLPFGGTDSYYVASAFYAYSASLVSKAAKVLGYEEDCEYYQKLSDDVKKAICEEYFTPNGKCAVNTQTAKIMALFMELVPERFYPRIIDDLKLQLEENDVHLETGFVGTTYINRVLSDNGLNHLAYTLLLNEDLPSWLYEINMGATTIWERWNSVLPDGLVNPQGMNSMNHYTYGSVVEWMYRNMCGLNPSENKPGFRKAIIKPIPDKRIGAASCTYDSPIGLYKSGWLIEGNEVTYSIAVPFGGEAELSIHGLKHQVIKAGEYTFKGVLPEE